MWATFESSAPRNCFKLKYLWKTLLPKPAKIWSYNIYRQLAPRISTQTQIHCFIYCSKGSIIQMNLSIKGKGKTNNNKTRRTVGLSLSELRNWSNRRISKYKYIWSTREEATFICIIHASQSILWEVNDNIGEELTTYRMPKVFDKTPCPFRELQQLSWCVRAHHGTGNYIHEPVHCQATGLHPSEVSKEFTIS